MPASHAQRLDGHLAELNAQLAPLREFVLPGGTRAAAACHLARAVCRRAERLLSALGRIETVSAESRQYLNRLSDLLFVCARTLNAAAGQREAQWSNNASPGESA